jgi:hypothetical protein
VSGKWRLSCSASNRFHPIIRSEPPIPATAIGLSESPDQQGTCKAIVGIKTHMPELAHHGVRR